MEEKNGPIFIYWYLIQEKILSTLNHSEISILIRACQEKDRAGQFRLYDLFYDYGISIANQYAKNKETAKEVLNDCFLKIFAKINQFDQTQSFSNWFRVIIIHTAIDYHRKNKHFNKMVELTEKHYRTTIENEAWKNLLYEDVVAEIQKLSPGYREVFHLYAIEQFKHHEIAKELNISIGTSKSNLFKARQKLQLQLKIVQPN